MRRTFLGRVVPGRAWRAVFVGGVFLGLTACVSLLPKEKPAQQYLFGANASASVARPASGPGFTVRAAPITFERAAASDRILTVNGEQTAFIAGARWVSPAISLFGSATTRAFDTQGGAARLLAPGQPAAADYLLTLDVRTFEARYGGGGEAPRIVVEVYAALDGRKDPLKSQSQVFQAEARASSNSVSAIASAFDVAVGKVLGDIVTWVDAKGAS
jgi:cholesterol transport system auxiliary component